MMMKKLLLLLSTFALVSGLFVMQTAPAFAQGGVTISPELRPDYAPTTRGEDEGATAEQSFGATGVNLLIGDIALVLIQMSGVLAIYFIVVNALTYVKSFGRDEEIQKAKKGLIWALAGLLIVIVSYAIVQNIIRIVLSVDESQVSILGVFDLF
jgi:hypothetical protein